MKRSELENIIRQAAAEEMRAAQQQQQATYKNFTATELYCPKCKCAQPVREHKLLILPSGDLYDYRCSVCGSSVGSKTA